MRNLFRVPVLSTFALTSACYGNTGGDGGGLGGPDEDGGGGGDGASHAQAVEAVVSAFGRYLREECQADCSGEAPPDCDAYAEEYDWDYFREMVYRNGTDCLAALTAYYSCAVRTGECSEYEGEYETYYGFFGDCDSEYTRIESDCEYDEY